MVSHSYFSLMSLGHFRQLSATVDLVTEQMVSRSLVFQPQGSLSLTLASPLCYSLGSLENCYAELKIVSSEAV